MLHGQTTVLAAIISREILDQMQRMQMGSVVSKCSTNTMLGAALASRCTMQLDAAEAGCIVMQMHNSEMHSSCVSIVFALCVVWAHDQSEAKCSLADDYLVPLRALVGSPVAQRPRCP